MLKSKTKDEVRRSVIRCTSIFPQLITVFQRVRSPRKGLGLAESSFSEKHYFNGLIFQPGIMHSLTDFIQTEWFSYTPTSSGQKGRRIWGNSNCCDGEASVLLTLTEVILISAQHFSNHPQIHPQVDDTGNSH